MKSVLTTLLIIFLLGCVIILTFTVFNNVVDISEFNLDNDFYAKAEIDFDRNGKKDKIELIGENKKIKDNDQISSNNISNIFQNYKLLINDQEFEITPQKGHSVISFAIADLNGDYKNEILVCTSDMMISPSYRQWMIYSFDGEFLRYIGQIYDGNISYNYLTNKLLVIYKLHETKRTMYDFKTYDLKFIVEGFPKD